LWLVSMDPKRLFTFLDDRLVSGDSLLGLGSLRTLSGDAIRDLRLERDLAEAKNLRAQITDLADSPQTLPTKHELLGRSRGLTRRALDYADLRAGGWLA